MTEQNAVVFDWTAFRAWLDLVQLNNVDGRRNRDAVEAFATGYQPGSGEAGWLIEAALDAVRDATVGEGVDVWSTVAGVDQVRVWTVADPEGGESGIAGEIVVDGVPLSLGLIADNDLIRTEEPMLPGYEAAEIALAALAERANEAVAHYVASRMLFGVISPGEAEQALEAFVEFYQRGDGDLAVLSGPQKDLAERVSVIVERALAGGDVVDGEIVDDEDESVAAYNRAAATVDDDVNHPAHPTHW